MFDPSLRLLERLQTRGVLRRLWRKMKTPAGILGTLVFLGFMSMALLPQAFLLYTGKGFGGAATIMTMPTLISVALFGVACGMTNSETGQKLMELRPPELPFVLAGPFSTSQILTYRLRTLGLSWLLLSVFVIFMSAPNLPNLLGGWLGIYLAGAFIFSLTFVRALIAPQLSPWHFTAFRAACYLAWVAIIGELFLFGDADWDSPSFSTLTSLLESSVLARIFGAPFLPFANLISGATGTVMFVHLALALLAVVGSVAACYRFNDGFAELAVEGVSRRQERMDRVKGGNLYARKPKQAEVVSRIPTLSGWGGAGPIARVEIITIFRRFGGLIKAGAAVSATASLALVVVNVIAPLQIDEGLRRWAVLIAMAAAGYLGFVCLLTAQVGLTRNPRSLTPFQTLAIRPLPLGAGMIGGGLAFLTSLRIVLVLPAIVINERPWGECIAIVVASFVIDMAMVSVVNLVAVVTNVRPQGNGVPDMFQGVRSLLFMLALSLGSLPIVLLGAIGFGIAFLLTGFSITTSVIGAAIPIALAMPVIWFASGMRFQTSELPIDS